MRITDYIDQDCCFTKAVATFCLFACLKLHFLILFPRGKSVLVTGVFTKLL